MAHVLIIDDHPVVHEGVAAAADNTLSFVGAYQPYAVYLPAELRAPTPLAVFVHGCFWHRHRCRFGCATPSTRAAFWQAKFAANVSRDRRTLAALRRAGWHVLIVWECQTRDKERLRARLATLLLRFEKRT